MPGNETEPLSGALCSALDGALWGGVGALVPDALDDEDYWEAIGGAIGATSDLVRRGGADVGNSIGNSIVGPGHWRDRMRQIEEENGLGNSVWPGVSW